MRTTTAVGASIVLASTLVCSGCGGGDDAGGTSSTGPEASDDEGGNPTERRDVSTQRSDASSPATNGDTFAEDGAPTDHSDGGSTDASTGRDTSGRDGRAPSTSDADTGSDAPVVPGECVEPESGMIITEDTALCGGAWTMSPVGNNEAAIRIAGDGVTVSCRGTVLEHAGPYAERRKPNAGFLVDNWSNVEIHGCAALGFRYGLIAKKTENLEVVGVDFSGNFDDPDKRRVFNPTAGGGIRLVGAEGGVVRDSTLGDNWNGIELVDSRDVEVRSNETVPTSNSGASLLDSSGILLTKNDFSQSVRGENLSFPDRWYGRNTKDAAGVIVDDGSTNNRIVDNTIRQSGDGIALRNVTGFCATDNVVEDNELSGIAHHAIDSTCDDNDFIDNTIDKSRFGLWLEGASETLVRGNRIRSSRVDGISVQIADNRHVDLVGNTIAGSGRAGLLVSGRTYRARHDLSRWGSSLGHASHLLVQRNTFRNNAKQDVFVTSARSLLMASNCPNDNGLSLEAGRESMFVERTGDCATPSSRTPPKAAVDVPSSTRVGTPTSLDASDSKVRSTSGGSLNVRWLVQSARSAFEDGMPAVVAGGAKGRSIQTTFPEPGLFDVSVIVDDGMLGDMAWERIAVLPKGTIRGSAARNWHYGCATGDKKPISGEGNCSMTIGTSFSGLEQSAVKVRIDASYDFKIYFPKKKGMNLDVRSKKRLGLFLKASNPNGRGWQGGDFPIVGLENDKGAITYRPTSQKLPTTDDQWTFLSIPLDGGGDWKRKDEGGSLKDVDRVALQADTWGWDPVDIWIDGVVFY